MKRKSILNVLYWILFAVIVVIDLILLELCHNTIIGWCAAIALFVVFVFFSRKNKPAVTKKARKKRGITLLILVVLLGVSGKLTGPPERQVPATDAWHPDVTDVVTVEQGDLTGVYTKDHAVEVYAGIPYAKPPVGDLRFAEPQEPEQWDGIRACDHFAPMAMQQRNAVLYDSLVSILGYHNYQISLKDNYKEPVSEDCLYLNVWKPSGEADDLPVLFYIHGGSLMNGQSYDA